MIQLPINLSSAEQRNMMETSFGSEKILSRKFLVNFLKTNF